HAERVAVEGDRARHVVHDHRNLTDPGETCEAADCCHMGSSFLIRGAAPPRTPHACARGAPMPRSAPAGAPVARLPLIRGAAPPRPPPARARGAPMPRSPPAGPPVAGPRRHMRPAHLLLRQRPPLYS